MSALRMQADSRAIAVNARAKQAVRKQRRTVSLTAFLSSLRIYPTHLTPHLTPRHLLLSLFLA